MKLRQFFAVVFLRCFELKAREIRGIGQKKSAEPMLDTLCELIKLILRLIFLQHQQLRQS